MNEEELKQIWRTKEKIPLKSINMEFIQQYTLNTQTSLRKLSRKELIAALIASVIFALDFIYSGNFYFVLAAITALWVYIIWDNRRQARLDEMSRTENVKNYLIGKEEKLKRETVLIRTAIFLGAAAFAFNLKLIEEARYLDESFRASHPGDTMTSYIVFLIVSVIIVQVCCEIYIRLNYYPILEDLRYLIEELSGENDNNER